MDFETGDNGSLNHDGRLPVGGVFGEGVRPEECLTMLKWILTLVIAIFLLGIIAPHLARFIRLGQLPGDFSCRFRGRVYQFPLATTLLFSALLWLLSRLV